MDKINEFLILVDGYIGSAAWFPIALLGTGIFFTFYLKFPQVRYFRFAFRVIAGRYDKKHDVGDTTHFQALTTALSGTVGTGNIAGVALALHIGGPSALFWMLVTAFVGMCTKLVEVTLSHKYRETAEDGSMAGGPMYYMKNKLNMRWLAVIFAVATVLSSLGSGSFPQINSITDSMYLVFGFDRMLVGGILSVLLGLVIIGGIKRIAAFTSKLVPAMAILYFIGAFAVIFYNIENLIPSFISIFSHLFTGTAATGGFLGASIAFAFNKGVGRGLFSNEAGQGSAPIAHASAKAHEPVSEGLVAILEPFIDTIVICTLTGLVLLSSGVWNEKHQNTFSYTDMLVLDGVYLDDTEEGKKEMYQYVNDPMNAPLYNGNLEVKDGRIITPITVIHARSLAENVTVQNGDKFYTGKIEVERGKPVEMSFIFKGESLVHSSPLTSIAFTKGFFGDWGQYIVTIGLLLFAFSTAISWSYYGGRAMYFLFGAKSVTYYRVLFIVGFFIASFTDTTIIWTVAAITVASMTIPNLFGILMLRKDMKESISEYWQNFKKEWPEEKIPK